jgi:hypothetical protein
MTEFTDYTEQEIIEWLLEGTAPATAPGTVYVALWSTNPANSPDPTNEISGSGYSVQSVGTSGGWVRDVTGGPTRDENGSTVDFGVLDSSTSITVEGVVLFDGSDTSTANALAYDKEISESVSPGGEFRFEAGNLTVAAD